MTRMTGVIAAIIMHIINVFTVFRQINSGLSIRYVFEKLNCQLRYVQPKLDFVRFILA